MSDRQTGRSTRQLLAAPSGAYYVVPSLSARAYYRDLAHRFGRQDLQLVTPSFFDRDWRASILPVVVDHAAHDLMTPEQRSNYLACCADRRRHGVPSG